MTDSDFDALSRHHIAARRLGAHTTLMKQQTAIDLATHIEIVDGRLTPLAVEDWGGDFQVIVTQSVLKSSQLELLQKLAKPYRYKLVGEKEHDRAAVAVSFIIY